MLAQLDALASDEGPQLRRDRLALRSASAPVDAGAVEGPQGPPTRQRPPRTPDPKRDAKGSKARLRRRAAGIASYVGPNGSGKSLAMVFDTLPTLDGQPWHCSEPTHRHMAASYVDPLSGRVGPQTSGTRLVLSTVSLYDPETGLPHPLFRRLCEANGGWGMVLGAEHCDLLFDEVTGIAAARDAMGMPRQVQVILDQLRKRDVLMRWTAPAWGRADTTIRGVTNSVTLCRGFASDRSQLRSDTPPAWLPHRLFKWRTFDARDFEEFTLAKAAGDKKHGSRGFALRASPVQWFWGPGSRAFSAYDSYGAVSRIASYLDSGRCAHCGGTRAVPKCSCDDH